MTKERRDISETGYIIMTLLLSILLNGISYILRKGLDVSLIQDEIGTFATVPFLAGLDWSWAVSHTYYYGFGYYWIFFPLLKLTDNYLFIYIVVSAVNFMLCCSVSMLIYRIITKEMMIHQRWIAVLLGAFCTTSAFRLNGMGMANEYPCFIIAWVICFILLKLYDTRAERKKNFWYSVVLAAACTYGLTIHERMMALCIGITIAVVIARLKFKYSFLNEKIFFPLLLGGFGLQRVVRRMVVAKVWLIAENIPMKNMNVISRNSFSFIKGRGTILAAFDCMLTNLYKLILASYGLAAIAIIVVLLGLFIKKNAKVAEMIQDMQKQYLIILIYGIAILVTIVGLATMGSTPNSILEGYQTGTPTYGYKTFFYLRYYQPYIGPAFAASYVFILKYSDVLKKYIKIALLAVVLVFVYLCYEIFPKLKDTVYLSERGAQWTPVMAKWLKDTSSIKIQIFNVGLSFLLLLLLIFLTFYFQKKLCRSIWIILIFLPLVRNISLARGIGVDIGGIVCQNAGAAYDFIQDIEDETDLPQEVYCLGDVYTYQFVLNQYSVIGGMPDESLESIILFAPSYIDEQENMEEYYYMQLDENEWVYIKGDKLITDLLDRYELISCKE